MNYFTEATPNILQIDLDNKPSVAKFKRQLTRLKRTHHLNVRKVIFHKSRSGNIHATVVMSENLPIMERIALQAILGSDIVRELCNYGRAKNHAPAPIVFIHRRPRKKQ